MKQLDYDSSNYKYKEDIKVFVNTFNEIADKYVKGLENSDADLKKVTANIAKKNTAIEKLEASLLDLGNKTTELAALKDLSNEEIKSLNAKKSLISYTDSEVQKMELDDINSQITAKKGKISKIDAKIDATKAKIKTSNEEKKTNQKELQELEIAKVVEEEALFKTQSLIELVKELKDEMNSRSLEIVNSTYKSIEEKEAPVLEPEVHNIFEEITEQELSNPVEEEIVLEEVEEPINEADVDLSVLDYSNEDAHEEGPSEDVEDVETDESSNAIEEEPYEIDSLLKDKFEKEGIDVNKFKNDVKERMSNNKQSVISNMEILKKHGIPLEYTVDQPEIYYNISSQDLDDLLSIITTDDEGNGMGFTIDFTYNILSELSKINVDKLIDVYNNEFMNVNAKSGIIYLLKLTNHDLGDFEKNRKTNIEILRGLGANTVDEIIERHPEFVNIDNPLFVNILNVFDKSDLVEKLNSDVDVVTKIIEYWKNN